MPISARIAATTVGIIQTQACLRGSAVPQVVEVTCWRVYGWGQGRWTLRSTHATPDDAADHAEALCHRSRIRTRVQQATTLRAVPREAAPTAAQRFREEQADRMVIRRQAHTYYKSGCNGTELIDAGPD